LNLHHWSILLSSSTVHKKINECGNCGALSSRGRALRHQPIEPNAATIVSLSPFGGDDHGD
jgi:hypothetical protein